MRMQTLCQTVRFVGFDSRQPGSNMSGGPLQPLTEVPNMGHFMAKKGRIVTNESNSLNADG